MTVKAGGEGFTDAICKCIFNIDGTVKGGWGRHIDVSVRYIQVPMPSIIIEESLACICTGGLHLEKWITVIKGRRLKEEV